MAAASTISRVLGNNGFQRSVKKKTRIKRLYDWSEGFIVRAGSKDTVTVEWSTGWSKAVLREQEKIEEMSAVLKEAGYSVTSIIDGRVIQVS